MTELVRWTSPVRICPVADTHRPCRWIHQLVDGGALKPANSELEPPQEVGATRSVGGGDRRHRAATGLVASEGVTCKPPPGGLVMQTKGTIASAEHIKEYERLRACSSRAGRERRAKGRLVGGGGGRAAGWWAGEAARPIGTLVCYDGRVEASCSMLHPYAMPSHEARERRASVILLLSMHKFMHNPVSCIAWHSCCVLRSAACSVHNGPLCHNGLCCVHIFRALCLIDTRWSRYDTKMEWR